MDDTVFKKIGGLPREFSYNFIYKQRDNFPEDVAKELCSMEKHWQQLTLFYWHKNIPKTNNDVEQYYGQTHPEYVKRQFKTVKGLQHHLKLKQFVNAEMGMQRKACKT